MRSAVRGREDCSERLENGYDMSLKCGRIFRIGIAIDDMKE